MYEIIAGTSLYRLLLQLGCTSAPCLVLDLSDADARLLSLALNNIHGEEDLGLKAEAVRVILQSIPQEEVLAILPESSQGLQALASLGHADMAACIKAWEQVRAARLHHLTLQLTKEQLPLVEEALKLALLEVKGEGAGPNVRGTAMSAICSFYIHQKGAVLYT
jgi:ParB family chromosome partitioning protein